MKTTNEQVAPIELEDVITELKSAACLLNAVSLGDASGQIYLFEGTFALTGMLLKSIERLEKIEADLFATKGKK